MFPSLLTEWKKGVLCVIVGFGDDEWVKKKNTSCVIGSVKGYWTIEKKDVLCVIVGFGG